MTNAEYFSAIDCLPSDANIRTASDLVYALSKYTDLSDEEICDVVEEWERRKTQKNPLLEFAIQNAWREFKV